MKDGDGVLFRQFPRRPRPRDRRRAGRTQFCRGFARDKRIAFAAALGLTEYSEELNPFLATLFRAG